MRYSYGIYIYRSLIIVPTCATHFRLKVHIVLKTLEETIIFPMS